VKRLRWFSGLLAAFLAAGHLAFAQVGAPVAGSTGVSGVTGVTSVVTAGGIPFIGLSSGSVSAAGAISGITALPSAYPSAYCYLPANIVATVATAGWRYCTFSTTTAGTVFLDTYTSGKPTIPASPTAVTDGKGAFTGDLTEEAALTLTLPALTATSALRITLGTQQTNNANVKTLFVRASGSAGTIFVQQTLTSLANNGMIAVIASTGNTAKQVAYQASAFGANITTNGVLGTVDLSTGAATLVVSFSRATATDNVVLLPPVLELVN
jgi:hypothetical protein